MVASALHPPVITKNRMRPQLIQSALTEIPRHSGSAAGGTKARGELQRRRPDLPARYTLESVEMPSLFVRAANQSSGCEAKNASDGVREISLATPLAARKVYLEAVGVSGRRSASLGRHKAGRACRSSNCSH